MSVLLGIDIGTSSVKAALFDSDTRTLLAVSNEEYALHKPAPDRAEQNPEDWWQATIQTVRRVMDQSGLRTVHAISYSGQMHGTVLLDRNGEPVHPAIIWADSRSSQIVESLLATIGEDRYVNLTGTRPAVGFMVATLGWLARHQPETLHRAAHVILPKDYVRYRMTGVIASEYSDAASTGLFDIRQRTWSQLILDAAKLPESLFPSLLSPTDIAGELVPDAAEHLGLSAGIPVVAGCADQPAAAIANGIIAAGTASITVGSGGQVFMPVTTLTHTDSRLHLFNHVVPDGWYALGATLSAGLSLRWLRDLLGLSSQADAYAQLSQAAAEVSPGADGLIFLPYLSGERTPHMDPQARGAFIGLSAYHGRGHLARAVMEGVVFSLKQTLAICEGIAGEAQSLIVSGGAVTSPVWRQLLSDIVGLPLQTSHMPEQSATGAALLAGVGTGIFDSFETVREDIVRYDNHTQPETLPVYRDRYEQFVELYPRLRDDFHQLTTGINPTQERNT